MAQNLSLVYDGLYAYCPEHPERYLSCFWEDFSACQDSWKVHSDVPTVNQISKNSVNAITQEDFPEWLWEAMAREGHILIRSVSTSELLNSEEIGMLDPDMFLQLKLSVVRAIMTKVIFKPRAYITEKSELIVDKWRQSGSYEDGRGIGLIVHIRRTDKKEDKGSHWRHIDFNSTKHMGPYIQAMESTIGAAFSRFMIMSDDPHMQSQAAKELTPYFKDTDGTQSLYSNSLCISLGSNNVTDYTGHTSLDRKARHDLYVSAWWIYENIQSLC